MWRDKHKMKTPLGTFTDHPFHASLIAGQHENDENDDGRLPIELYSDILPYYCLPMWWGGGRGGKGEAGRAGSNYIPTPTLTVHIHYHTAQNFCGRAVKNFLVGHHCYTALDSISQKKFCGWIKIMKLVKFITLEILHCMVHSLILIIFLSLPLSLSLLPLPPSSVAYMVQMIIIWPIQSFSYSCLLFLYFKRWSHYFHLILSQSSENMSVSLSLQIIVCARYCLEHNFASMNILILIKILHLQEENSFA